MIKKIITVVIAVTLFAGFSFSPAQADSKLESILQITGHPAEIDNLKARLDRDQLVYGLPTDVPNNDWKSASTDVDGKDWQTVNGIDLGHSGEEPRYLGYTWNGVDLFSNDWFPDDAPNQIAPAKRVMISEPWRKGHCNEQESNDISDYIWSVIKKTLASYNERIVFPGTENSFTNNPAFQGDFDKIKNYFKVLSEPKPGLTGAVRHWHNRDGGVYYDTITVRWGIIPDFIVESIDPGTEKAEDGITYTGKVILKAKPDTSFLSDPLTSQLFDVMNLEQTLPQDYTVPFGVVVNDQLVPVKDLQSVPELNNVYQYNVNAGTVEDTLEITFDWTAGNGPITIVAGVNTTLKVLSQDTWSYMDWSELEVSNNIKEVEVHTDTANLIALRIHPGVIGEAEPGGEYIAAVDFKNDSDKELTGVPVGGFNREYRAVLKDAADNEVQYADFAPGETKTFFFTYHTPDAGTTTISGVIDTPPMDDLVDESNEQDNKVNVDITVRETNPVYGDLRLNLQAYSKAGEDVYGNWHDSKARQAFTAKWTDDVKATLTVPMPTPPKGKLDWWKISWAKITYPKKNPDFQFGDPLPPQGTVTKSMNVPGSGTESEKKATLTFEEDWGMDGAGIYNMIRDEVMAEYQKNYPISVSFEVTYQYTYTVCHGFTCSQVTKTSSYTDTATANLKVDGTGVGSYAQ